jgi:hypothetical protein
MTAVTPAERPALPRPGCLNCGESIAQYSAHQPARFCAACGQETNVQPPTLREFAQQFGGAYFSTEGAMWRTLKLLLTRPGELTARYLAGQRKHYVLPLRLYLTISVLALLLLRVLGSGTVEVKPDDVDKMAAENGNLTIKLGSSTLGLKNHVFFCENLPQWLCTRAQRRIDIDPKSIPAEMTGMKDRFMSSLGGALFVLLPTFAASLRLVYRSRKLRYTEHLVFALHVHTFWFLALAVMVSGISLLVFVAVLAVPAYALKAMKRVYGGRWWPLLLRASLVSFVYLMVLAFAMAGVGLWALLV